MITPNISVFKKILYFGIFLIGVISIEGACASQGQKISNEVSYTVKSGVLFQDGKDPFLFYAYTINLDDTNIGPPSYRYLIRDIQFKDGKFIEGALQSVDQKQIENKFSYVQDREDEIIDKMAVGSTYVLFKNIKISGDITADASATRPEQTEIDSHLIFNIGTRSLSRDYEGGLIREIAALNTGVHSEVGVIIDYCGASSCSSVLEILKP